MWTRGRRVDVDIQKLVDRLALEVGRATVRAVIAELQAEQNGQDDEDN